MLHQDIAVLEKTHAGKSVQEMLADYCWNFKQDVSGGRFKKEILKMRVKMSFFYHVFLFLFLHEISSYSSPLFLKIFTIRLLQNIIF
ncbi:hypothetical protein C0J52_13260 [Blattella germanica]|nr:hypothetical protein C0J52_13260 [Blattella germanica]